MSIDDIVVCQIDMKEYKLQIVLLRLLQQMRLYDIFSTLLILMHHSEAYRWRLHVDIMKYIVAAHCLKGIVTTCGLDYTAVVL